MERHNKPSSSTNKPKPKLDKAVVCRTCHCYIKKGECKCPGPPRGRRQRQVAVEDSSSNQLLNGAPSLLTYTKTNDDDDDSNVPETNLRLSLETKPSTQETKLPLRDTECLNKIKEAVKCSSNDTEINIFENDFVDVVSNTSSHAADTTQYFLEKTPVKEKIVTIPATPVKLGTHATVSPKTPEPSCTTARHSCPFCAKTFRSNGKLNSHVFSHTGERPFACKHCHKAFSSKFKLVRHLLIHSEDRKFLCTVCDRGFLRNDHLKNHYKIHDPRKVVFKCDRAGCDKEYSSALSHRKHEAWHRAQDGHLVCLLCGIKQENTAEMLLHLRRHSGNRMMKTPADRKFRCHVCERDFLTRKDVTRHLVVHTGERDFLCQFCPQRFGRKDHLVRHIKKSHHAPAKKKINKSILTLNKKKNMKDFGKSIETDDSNDMELAFDDDDVDDLSDSSNGNPLSPIGNPLTPTGNPLSPSGVPLTPTENPLTPPGNPLTATGHPVTPTGNQFAPTGNPLSSHDPTLPSMIPTVPQIQLFDNEFNMATPEDSLIDDPDRDSQDRKEDLFGGTPQSLLFEEPSFDDVEYKESFGSNALRSDDLILTQSENSGELLRYLLQSEADAPLPGFSQIFSSCPPSASSPPSEQ